MRTLSPIAPWALLLAVAPAAASTVGTGSTAGTGERSPAANAVKAESSDSGALAGRVSGERTPLLKAAVYAYQVADLSLRRATTDAQGRFQFDALPAGLYKIIAHKPGFVPAVVLLTRATASTYQYLDLNLTHEAPASTIPAADFWRIREKIPPDILREIEIASTFIDEAIPTDSQALEAQINALSGVMSGGQLGSLALRGGEVELRSHLGALEMGVDGLFRRLEGGEDPMASAQTQSLALYMSTSARTRVEVSGLESRHALQTESDPIDYSHYNVRWSQGVGRGRTAVTASYTDESRFYGGGQRPLPRPASLPVASRTWFVNGIYESDLGARSSMRTGLSYQQRAGRQALSLEPETEVFDRLEVFGLADWSLSSSQVLEYGLFTTVQESGLAVLPRAGLTWDLGSHWRAETAVQHRFASDNEGLSERRDFVPAHHGEQGECGTVDQHCYKVSFAWTPSDDESLTIGALHRELAETLRVFFTEDVFAGLEDGIFLVSGDVIPELQFGLSHNLGESVHARLRSNIGSGGGGVFHSAGEGNFENEVRYLVTAVDTRFRPTETDLTIAFHRTEQRVSPVNGQGAGRGVATDRLRILLRQQLAALLGLASDWAVQLDMQVSRGQLPFQTAASSDEIYRRVIGGLAVKF